MTDLLSLITDLQAPTVKNRQIAARELGKSGNLSAIEPLSAALSDPHPMVRGEIVQALGRLGDSDAVPALITALADSEPTVRCAANFTCR
ncbi:MAG: hypothetical protein CVV34_03475, partial [Methanomicrobiales archaeon HGW-Methanomicrobiales-5]